MGYWFLRFNRPAASLIELVVAVGISALLLPALLTGLVSSREGKAQQIQRLEATALLEEAIEATRSVRDGGWTVFANNGLWHPEVSGTSWSLAEGTEPIGTYTRSVEIEYVHRDASGNIVTVGGTNDPSTRRVTATVSWQTPLPSSVSTSFYLTRYMDNLVYTETTLAQFEAGDHSGTAATNTSGGEVILGSGGGSSWCEPDLSIAALDLPKNGVANALTAIEGEAFAGTGDNASGVSFADVLISNNRPPAAAIPAGGTFNGYKTNDVYGENNFAYLATDTNSKEIVIVSLTTNPLSETGYFNAPGVTQAGAVFVSGNTGYMTAGNVLYSFDLTSKSGARPVLDPDGVTLAGSGYEIHVVGTYAYVAVDSASNQLQIIDVSNPSNLTVRSQITVPGGGGRDVHVNDTGSRAYLATAGSSTQREMFIINTENKSAPALVSGGNYDTSGMSPKGITVVSGNKLIIVGTGGLEYQVVDITNEGSPAGCGSLNVDTGVNGVASVLESDGDAYSYIITGDASSEFKIIEGGPGGSFSTSGTYESAPYDFGIETAVNYFFATVATPPDTAITFQLAVADAVGGSCASASYVYNGPDGTSSTFYQASGDPVWSHDDGAGYENPGRCFRYKAYFAGTSNSPVLYDANVNYSP